MLEHVDTERFAGERVGVLYGGESPERPVSLETGEALAQALRERGWGVSEYDFPAQRDELLEDPPAAVLLAFHGGAGEDGTVQGFLETVGIPYTGSGVLASALAIDKGRSKAVFRDAGLMTPSGQRLTTSQLRERDASYDWEGWLRRAKFEFPLVVKPTDGGSSQGVEICEDLEELRAATDRAAKAAGSGASAGVLIEEFIDGDEYSVGFFGRECLGAIQVVAADSFYDYSAKYESDETEYRTVERPGLMQRLKAAGQLAYTSLGCRGVARVDFMARRERGDEVLYVLEVNTIPGMTATSLVPKMADNHGIDYGEFAELMLSSASLESEDSGS